MVRAERSHSLSSSSESHEDEERRAGRRLVRFDFGSWDEDESSVLEEPLEESTGRSVSPGIEDEIRHRNRLRRVDGFAMLVQREMQQERLFNRRHVYGAGFPSEFIPGEWENNGVVDAEEPYPDVANPVPPYTAYPGEGETIQERFSLAESVHLPSYEEIFPQSAQPPVGEQGLSETDNGPSESESESEQEQVQELQQEQQQKPPLEESYILYGQGERPLDERHIPRVSPRMVFMPLVAGVVRRARRIHRRMAKEA